MRIQTYTWVILPTGKRIKKILPLDERLSFFHSAFTDFFGVSPNFIFLRVEMAKDWEGDVVLGMEIIRLKKNYPLHNYTFAVTKEDFTGVKDDRPHGIDRTSNHGNSTGT